MAQDDHGVDHAAEIRVAFEAPEDAGLGERGGQELELAPVRDAHRGVGVAFVARYVRSPRRLSKFTSREDAPTSTTRCPNADAIACRSPSAAMASGVMPQPGVDGHALDGASGHVQGQAGRVECARKRIGG